MKAELISVGTEILLGEILNSDAQFLSCELSEIGIDVYHQTVVGDNRERLLLALENAFSRSDIVITSGGLGPTPDDITKEVVSEFMNEKLVLHEESYNRIKDYFDKLNRYMPENNIKQAMMPEHCVILENNCGTAPGCIINKDDKIAIVLPGPPRELTRMYKESVKPYLVNLSKEKLFTKTFHMFGIGESALAEEISDLMANSSNPTVAPYAKTGEVHLRLAAKAENAEIAESIMRDTDNLISSKFGQFIYSTDDKNLPETVFEKLLSNKITISTAESCTGGLIAKTITDFPGSSDIFSEGYVTYSNEAKNRLLNVKKETLEKFGAVSAETAEEMVLGVKKISGSDVAIAVTGIAGPGGGSAEKPVGLVYAAVAYQNDVTVKKLLLNGDREKVRYLTMLNVFSMINDIFKNS